LLRLKSIFIEKAVQWIDVFSIRIDQLSKPSIGHQDIQVDEVEYDALEELDNSGDYHRDHRVDRQEGEVVQPSPEKLDQDDTTGPLVKFQSTLRS
jgi:hypothetical protein